VWRCRSCGTAISQIPPEGFRFCPKCKAWVDPKSLLSVQGKQERERQRSSGPLVESTSRLRQNLIAALSDEIAHVKERGGSSVYKLKNGELFSHIGSNYIYKFQYGGEPLPDDLPARLRIPSASELINAEIVSFQGLDVFVSVGQNLGRTIPEAEALTDPIFLLEALKDHIEKSNSIKGFNEKIPSYLFGLATPKLSQTDHQTSSLNDFQAKAVAKSLGSEIFLIWGPPGTGKTTTLAAIIQESFRNGETTLVTSNTNIAVDNQLMKAEEAIRRDPKYAPGDIIRLGTPQAQDFPPKLLPSVIAAEMSAELDRQISGLQAKLSQLDETHDQKMSLLKKTHQASELSIQIRNAEEEERIGTKAVDQLKAKLLKLKQQFEKARSATTIIRIIRQLDPEKLEKEIQWMNAQLNRAEARVADLSGRKTKMTADYTSLKKELGNETEQSLSSTIESIKQDTSTTRVKLEKLETRRREIESELITKAKVIGATLAKSWLRSEIFQKGFDTVVVDESSMATLPMLYFVCGLAKRRATLAGDFMQLPAIVQSDTENAKLWLKRNIFEIAGLTQEVDSSPKMEMLRRQYRMHPQISSLVNKYVYEGRLIDDESVIKRASTRNKLQPAQGSALAIYDTSGLKPWSTYKKGTQSRINLVHACLALELAKLAKSNGFKEIGIITPYRAQASFIRKLALDSGFGTEVEVATVHRFQGRQKEIIIFDISDSDPHKPSRLVSGRTTEHLKLLNVAISRPQDKLLVIANLDYVSRKIPAQ
jgi:DNA polymerase III delta prime subunit